MALQQSLSFILSAKIIGIICSFTHQIFEINKSNFMLLLCSNFPLRIDNLFAGHDYRIPQSHLGIVAL
jgi:hypothetical protein